MLGSYVTALFTPAACAQIVMSVCVHACPADHLCHGSQGQTDSGAASVSSLNNDSFVQSTASTLTMVCDHLHLTTSNVKLLL